jgi:formylglycine-generating enzyme required for sulfatase activity
MPARSPTRTSPRSSAGPGTSPSPSCRPTRTRRRPDHPVVHLTWADVEAYARWIGKDVPTEAEWEFAARGGLDGAEFAWGDEFTPGGRWMANTWQGDFPVTSTAEDGYTGTAPVGRYPANGYGLLAQPVDTSSSHLGFRLVTRPATT